MSDIVVQSQFISESFDFEKVAQQANGSVWYRCGGTVILASVTVDELEQVDDDFLPLTIQYIEKAYASAKFPSGFIKREGKPSDFETLTSRLIDRTLRPLFPKNYRYPTQMTIIVLSYDGLSDLQVCALNAASSALYASDIPIYRPANAVRIGKIQGEFWVYPNAKQMQESTLDLYVSGCYQDILMIEMRSLRQDSQNHALSEDELIEAIDLAKSIILSQSQRLDGAFKDNIKSSSISIPTSENVFLSKVEMIEQQFFASFEAVMMQMAKSERVDGLHKLAQDIALQMQWDLTSTINALEICQKRFVRNMILKERKRVDGRRLDEVRLIEIETNVLPNTHGSCLFKRGQTQALVVSTIGGEGDAQTYELLGDKSAIKERFMVHYNFPSFCVGEANIIGAPGRRELGHGNLAKRALQACVSDTRVVRLVSEILESNGSSSMATVCGGSLALKASGVQVDELVAGVAMGLIQEVGQYAILTDIMGLEDHCGDMDFKVAGTQFGITALQMDIKISGVDIDVLKEAINQAKEARLYILALMQKASETICINDAIVPTVLSFKVPTECIVEIIGQGGKTIKDIIDRFGVAIDLNRSIGEVKISGVGQNRLQQAKEYILDLLQKSKSIDSANYSQGQEFKGRVKKIVDFGAFIEMPNGGDGLLHISKIKAKKVELQENDLIECKILSINQFKIELDMI